MVSQDGCLLEEKRQTTTYRGPAGIERPLQERDTSHALAFPSGHVGAEW